MNIIVTACQVPFISGGAAYHVQGLVEQLRQRGHAVELVRFPFQFAPESAIESLMDYVPTLDLSRPNGQPVDRVISLQFPGYGVRHPHHVVWLMHQHRAVYELFDPATATPAQQALRARIHAYDTQTLGRARHVFANSPRVAQRLKTFNGLSATPLSHPPPLAEAFRCEAAEPYIFYPSRLESLKRQDLLIRAAALVRSNVGILIAGSGGQLARYQALIDELGLGHRVRLLGDLTEAEKLAFYARCLGVFYGPFDEDYGYVTLEAMLSAKPVITCTDSGGPCDWVVDGHTGLVVAPEPDAVASAIDALASHGSRAAHMGQQGRAHYMQRGVSWDATLAQLLSI
ncbi:MAG: glycosyltransferase family 4 protein [Rhodoferax sp.]